MELTVQSNLFVWALIPFAYFAPGCSLQAVDQASSDETTFNCPVLGPFTIWFTGAETAELTLAGRTHVLERQRTASGARYTGDGVDFWNRGEEAMLLIDGREYHCTTRAQHDWEP